jgi:hypothetical protein
MVVDLINMSKLAIIWLVSRAEVKSGQIDKHYV